MVFKVCKGGVRSGNTLRGLHTLRTRRYAGQACLVGRSSLSRKQVDRLLEESTEDAAVSNALKNTDVVLSLNKKERWRLPAAVNHMIRAGQFSDTKAIVSVLERHKLKRRANCVGFACSKSVNASTRGVQGKGQGLVNEESEGQLQGQKRYFSFNLDYVDQEESRRQWRKRRAEEIKRLERENKRKEKKDRRTDMKTVKVMTVEGRGTTKTGEKPMPSTKPEYRLEVFYPCPQSCSLTFNPKYTDVVMAQNDDGEMEVRANVKAEKKSQRKHRKRFTAGDLTAFSAEALDCEEDVEEMWREESEESEVISSTDTEYSLADNRFMTSEMQTTWGLKGGEEYDESSLQNREGLSENVLAYLVREAEKARAQWSCGSPRIRHRRTSGRQGEGDAGTPKSHIVYTDDAGKERKPLNNKLTSKYEDIKNTSAVPLIPESNPDTTLSSAMVILSSDEVAPHTLRTRFGNLYAEAACRPRRFCINVTDDATSLLSTSRSTTYTTYIVFTNAGAYDKGLETYNVTANCAACLESEHITHSMPYGLTTIDNVVNAFIGNLLDLKEAGSLHYPDDVASVNTQVAAPFHEMMMEKMKIQVDTFYTSDKFTRVCQSGFTLEEKTDASDDNFAQSLMQLAEDSDADIFCEICYDSINSTQIDAVPGTRPTACNHVFCDACWRQHLRTRFREGSVHMSCPGYQCEEKLDLATLLSLLHVTEVAQIFQRACEHEVEACPSAKWCPSPTCGRVIRLSTKSPDISAEDGLNTALEGDLCLDVACTCGETWCFTCLGPAHWPARCEQAHDYLEKMSTIKPVRDDTTEPSPTPVPTTVKPKPKPKMELVEVEGRLCPKCRRFIEKNGGCPHMSCRCGHQFCWACMAPYSGHSTCHPDVKTLYEYSRRVKVYHIITPTTFDMGESVQGSHKTKESESTKSTSRSKQKQKASMYQRALQQRMEAERASGLAKAIDELTTKISNATRKDLNLKREVLLQCGVPESDVPKMGSDDLVRMPVVKHVIRYLRSCEKARQPLLHVAEFTFVLLQDSLCSSIEKRRALRVASDLCAYCSFSLSVLQTGGNQDPRTALRRLADTRVWAGRTLDALLATVARLKN